VHGADHFGYVDVRVEDNIKRELWCDEGSRLNLPSLERIGFSYEGSMKILNSKEKAVC
jgi:hypothetical protein